MALAPVFQFGDAMRQRTKESGYVAGGRSAVSLALPRPRSFDAWSWPVTSAGRAGGGSTTPDEVTGREDRPALSLDAPVGYA
jgi:hypothetical protein